MKKLMITAIVATSSFVLAGCGANEPAPYGQAYIDQRPDGWQQEDGEQAAADCRAQLADDLGVELVTAASGGSDYSFGSPTNIVVGGRAMVHQDGEHPRDASKVMYLCEVNDPLGERMITIHPLS